MVAVVSEPEIQWWRAIVDVSRTLILDSFAAQMILASI